MPTLDLRNGGTTKLSAANGAQMTKMTKEIDFSKAANVSAAADVVQLFNLPAGTTVHQLVVDVTTAQGAACTADIGDDDDPNGFLDAVDLNVVAKTASAPGALAEGAPNTFSPAYGNGRFCAAAKILSMTLDHTTDAAVIKVTAFCTQA